MKIRFRGYAIKAFHWMQGMTEISLIRLCSNVIVIPGIVILFFYGVTGILLNEPLLYVIVGMLAVWCAKRQECFRVNRQQLEWEEEVSGRGLLNIRRGIEELRKMEQS